MIFEFDALSDEAVSKLLHSTVMPRPIAWVTSLDASGGRNMAPFSFFNVFGTSPAIVGFSIAPAPRGGIKDTLANIRATGDFVVHLVGYDNREAMNVTAVELPAEVDEIELAGLTAVPSVSVKAPRIVESPVAMECVLHSEIDLGGDRALVLGKVLVMHVRDEAIADAQKHYINAGNLDLIGRMHGRGWYSLTRDPILMERLSPDAVMPPARK